MPQARLPDINTAYIVYRREAIQAWKGRSYDSAIGSLYAFNGLLPDEYRVKISTQQYKEKTQKDLFVTCNKCSVQLNFRTVQVFNLLLPLLANVISGQEYEKVWNCTACTNTNKLFETKIIQKVLAEPSFLQLVPNPPERRDGMTDRTHFHIKFTVWFWTFLDELEAQAAKFRDDNWQKPGQEYEEADIGDSGEESD